MDFMFQSLQPGRFTLWGPLGSRHLIFRFPDVSILEMVRFTPKVLELQADAMDTNVKKVFIDVGPHESTMQYFYLNYNTAHVHRGLIAPNSASNGTTVKILLPGHLRVSWQIAVCREFLGQIIGNVIQAETAPDIRPIQRIDDVLRDEI